MNQTLQRLGTRETAIVSDLVRAARHNSGIALTDFGVDDSIALKHLEARGLVEAFDLVLHVKRCVRLTDKGKLMACDLQGEEMEASAES